MEQLQITQILHYLINGSQHHLINVQVYIDGTKQSYDYYTFHIPNSDETTGIIENLGISGTGANYTIPENGIAVFLVINNEGLIPEIGIQAFPIAIGSEISNSFGPEDDPSGTFTVTDHLIYCRGILMEFIFTLWDDFI